MFILKSSFIYGNRKVITTNQNSIHATFTLFRHDHSRVINAVDLVYFYTISSVILNQVQKNNRSSLSALCQAYYPLLTEITSKRKFTIFPILHYKVHQFTRLHLQPFLSQDLATLSIIFHDNNTSFILHLYYYHTTNKP